MFRIFRYRLALIFEPITHFFVIPRNTTIDPSTFHHGVGHREQHLRLSDAIHSAGIPRWFAPQTRRQAHPIPTVKFYDVKRLLEDKTAEPTAFGTYGDAEDDSELDAKEAEGVEDPTLGIPSSVPRHSDHFHLEEDGGEIELKSEALLDVLSEAPRPLARKATKSTVAPADSDSGKEDRIGESYDIWDLYS